MRRYSAVLTPGEFSGFVVEFPDLPWAITQGETEAECFERGADVVIATIEELIRRHAAIPKAKRHSGANVRLVVLPALVEAKIALYAALTATGLSRAALGRKLGLHPMQLDRLFDLRHASRMEQIEAALKVLGKRLSISVEDPA